MIKMGQQLSNLRTYIRRHDQLDRQRSEEEDQRIPDLDRQLSQKDERISDLSRQLRQEFEWISDLNRQLGQKDQRISDLEGQIRQKDQRISDLERQTDRKEQHWIINRNEVQITDTILGIGAWGKVFQGKFRLCDVAVKQIHENILSEYNRALFEREVDMASRCRHPCLLQFIGAIGVRAIFCQGGR